MSAETFQQFLDLGGTVAVVVAFIWYMRDRNGKQERAMHRMSEAVEKNTKVLIKVAVKHKLIKEVDELIE